MRPYRILVTGSREWSDIESIERELAAVIRRANTANPGREMVIIEGQCPTGGADQIAHDFARREGWGWERHPAKWQEYGKAAGTIRNQYMVDLGADICLAFPLPGSVGTWDCVRRANAAGIRVIVVPPRATP